MLTTFVLAAVLMPAPSSGPHEPCAATRRHRNRIDTEKEYLADIDRHIAAIDRILAKQPAATGNPAQLGIAKRQAGATLADAAVHFTAIGTDAAQADTTADFLRKDAAARKKGSAAFRAMTQAANQGSGVAARGSAKDVQAALDAVKAARAAR